MQAHYLQHVKFEGLGSIETWLQNAGYEISSTQLFRSGVLPEVRDIDFLIVMGGPMSVNDEAEYPWLVKEKDFIKRSIEAGIPVLGICLGAQLIANVMGCRVFPNAEKEIGWFPIESVTSGSKDAFQFPKEVEVFHWHGETFDLPIGAIRLAKSKGCENQAFQIGKNIIGLQFHLEATQESSQEIIGNCRSELIEGSYIQTEADILSVPEERYLSINSLMGRVLDHLHANNG
jgi:GMP synthase-like glutamine amidotransferase